jgi:hypothetical protein
MPRIAEFEGIRLYLYFRDHNPPHVHAFYGEFEALIVIADGSILSGNLPQRQHSSVMRYLEANRVDVTSQWNAAQKG